VRLGLDTIRTSPAVLFSARSRRGGANGHANAGGLGERGGSWPFVVDGASR